MTRVMRLYVADKKEVKGYRHIILGGCNKKKLERLEKILSDEFDVYTNELFASSDGYRKKRPDSYDLKDIGIEIHEGFHNFLDRKFEFDWSTSPQAYLFDENFACALEDYWTKRCVRSLKNEQGRKFLKHIEKRKRWNDSFRSDRYGMGKIDYGIGEQRGKKTNNGRKVCLGIYYSLYHEASLILKKYGVEKGVEIFEDTIEKASKRGFDRGLKHFLSYLPASKRKSVNVKNVLADNFRFENYDCKKFTPERLAKKITRSIKRKTE